MVLFMVLACLVSVKYRLCHLFRIKTLLNGVRVKLTLLTHPEEIRQTRIQCTVLPGAWGFLSLEFTVNIKGTP